MRRRSLTVQRTGSLEFLRRRIAYLTKRIEQSGPGARSFDVAERAALELAIEDVSRCEAVVKVLIGAGSDAEKLAALRSTLRIQEQGVRS